MLKVGINEPLYLVDVKITDKNWLELTWKQADAVEMDAFDALESEGYAETGDGTSKITIFPPLPPLEKDRQGNLKTEAKMAEEAQNVLKELKNQLNHILLAYMTQDKIKFNPYEGLGFTRENLTSLIHKKESIEAVAGNFFRGFVALVSPFVGINNDDTRVRLLCVRTSKAKHFPTLRRTYIADNPFLELASIPKEATKLKFTNYEIKEGLDNGDPVSATPDAQAHAEAVAAVDAASVFNQQ